MKYNTHNFNEIRDTLNPEQCEQKLYFMYQNHIINKKMLIAERYTWDEYLHFTTQWQTTNFESYTFIHDNKIFIHNI